MLNTTPNHNYNPNLQHYTHKLRKEMTKAEACLWKYALKANKMCGYTFRRQRPIDYYIADFACLELKLVIDADGATHLLEEIQIKDKRKDDYLQSLGYTVLRFKDEEILHSMNKVIVEIETTINNIKDNLAMLEENDIKDVVSKDGID
jgi:very-short-patch-repair endonuclease